MVNQANSAEKKRKKDAQPRQMEAERRTEEILYPRERERERERS